MNFGAVHSRFPLFAVLFLALAACQQAAEPQSPAAVVPSTAAATELSTELPAATATMASPTIPVNTREPTSTPAATAAPTASPTALPAVLAQINELDIGSCADLLTVDDLSIDEAWPDAAARTAWPLKPAAAPGPSMRASTTSSRTIRAIFGLAPRPV